MNVLQNPFKLLFFFFYAGLLIPAFKVNLEFPKAVFEGLRLANQTSTTQPHHPRSKEPRHATSARH